MPVDTHCHLTLRFDPREIPGVFKRAADANVHGLILVGYDPGHYQKVSALLSAYGTGGDSLPALAGSIGIHPHEADKYSADDISDFSVELEREEIVAIGETGLDFYRDYADRKRQEHLFRSQVRLSAETGYPLIVHSRSAFEKTIGILHEFTLPEKPGVFHCYGYGPDELSEVIAMGFYVSFAGNLTYPQAVELHHAASRVNTDRVLVETDSPFLIPQRAKNRKVRRNEPLHVIETAEKLAELKGLDWDKTRTILIDNTLACFPGLKALESWRSLIHDSPESQ